MSFHPFFQTVNEVIGYPVRVTQAFGEKPCIVILKKRPALGHKIDGQDLCDHYDNGHYYMITELNTDSYGNFCAIVGKETFE